MWFPSLRPTAHVTIAVGTVATSNAKTTGRNRVRPGGGRTAGAPSMLADAGILRWLHSGRNVRAAAETQFHEPRGDHRRRDRDRGCHFLPGDLPVRRLRDQPELGPFDPENGPQDLLRLLLPCVGMWELLRVSLVFAVLTFMVCDSAGASQLIDRKASDVHLTVSARGVAALSYTAHGARRHVIAWGARDAIAPTQSRAQVKLRLDYSGGWGTFGRALWQDRNACRPYRGPRLAWLVAACTAPDGSFWAVQRWQRMIPVGGAVGTWELHLSHWTGTPASLGIRVDARPRSRCPLRSVHIPRPPGLRVPRHAPRSAARHVCPQRLRRHVRLRVRLGMAPRERLPLTEPDRDLLLRPRPLPRKGHALPGDGVGAGSDPDRLVGRPRRARRGGRAHRRARAGRPPLWLIEFALWATSEH